LHKREGEKSDDCPPPRLKRPPVLKPENGGRRKTEKESKKEQINAIAAHWHERGKRKTEELQAYRPSPNWEGGAELRKN